MAFVKITMCMVVCLFATGQAQIDPNAMMAMSMMNNGGRMGGMAGMTNMGNSNNQMALARMTGMTGDMGPMDLAVLTSAVKAIVGMHATPSLTLIRYASMQGGQPLTFLQFMPYITFMEDIAKREGLQMPGTRQIQYLNKPATGNNGLGLPTKPLTLARMRSIINQRAIKWVQTRTMGMGIMG